MAVVEGEKAHPGHVELVTRLHDVLSDGVLKNDEAVSAAAELLGLVLINAIDDLPEAIATLMALSADIQKFMEMNWGGAAAARSLGRTTTARH